MKAIGDLLPPGVMNIISGKGSKSGQHMLDHSGSLKFTFTRSTEVGPNVGKTASDKLIPATLELESKGANIFFEDC